MVGQVFGDFVNEWRETDTRKPWSWPTWHTARRPFEAYA